jgi:hypothetical protein
MLESEQAKIRHASHFLIRSENTDKTALFLRMVVFNKIHNFPSISKSLKD